METRQSRQAALPEIELLGRDPARRSLPLTFGPGVAVFLGVIALVLTGSQFLIDSEARPAGISIALTPSPPAIESPDQRSARHAAE